jgi:Sulfotransferase family/Sulfotransferase domain
MRERRIDDAILFVTGMQRSGTTLLDKLLSCHRQISLVSQAFPFLFFEAKKDFFRCHGIEVPPYALGPLFVERGYVAEELMRHLAGWRVDASRLREMFAAMRGYSGQYTHLEVQDVDRALEGGLAGDLTTVVAALYRAFCDDVPLVGGKETLCEEFLPYFLDRGHLGAIIVRDPREVLASLNHGRGREHAGRLKPTLYNLRHWRKSVAFALHLEEHPRFTWVRYEDLAARPVSTLNRMAPVLGVEPFADDAFAAGIRGQDGRPWTGNSSHGPQMGIEGDAVGTRQALLPAGLARAVEAICYPELKYLGHPVSLEWGEVRDVLRRFEDPYPHEREELAEYRDTAAQVAHEIRRADLLEGAATAEEARLYFLFPDVRDALRRAVLST